MKAARMPIELWLNAIQILIPIFRCSYQLQSIFNLKYIGVDGRLDRCQLSRLDSQLEISLPSPFLQTLAGEAVSPPPIWLMRQAGRYLPEYRELRAQADGFLDLCYTPELAVEVTLQPIRRYGFDAAILFSDILVVPDALGASVDFVEGEGPKLSPVRDRDGVSKLSRSGLHAHLAPVYETLRRLRRELSEDTALIGFAGAPWTVAAYMVEGGGSKEFQEARTFARKDPATFSALIGLVVDATTDYLIAQIEAGAQALQLFDSWAGVLPPGEFQRWCVLPIKAIVSAVKTAHPEIPIIAFPRGQGRSTGISSSRCRSTVSAWIPRSPSTGLCTISKKCVFRAILIRSRCFPAAMTC